jgi:hypothetical protein
MLRKIRALLTPKSKLDRFAAERALVWQVYRNARKRRDTRGMNAASAQLQAVTHAQLRAEMGL